MKMIKFHLLKNNKGSVLLFNMSLILVVLIFLLGLIDINNNALLVLDKQNKQDAHAFSVISLYVYTINEISYTNKKLKELSFIYSVIKNIPALKTISISIEAVIYSIKKYQDYLLLRLKVEAIFIDLKLRTLNKLSLITENHLIKHRRQNNFFSFFNTELIEFKEDIFNTACIASSNVLSSNKVCVYNAKYFENKSSWFVSLDDNWSFKFYAK